MAEVAKLYKLLPDGKYQLSIISAQGIADSYGGLKLRLRIVDGEHQGHEFTSRVFLKGGTLSSLLESLVEGKQIKGTVRQISNKGRIYNVVDHFSATKEADHEKKPSGADDQQ